MLGRRFVAVWCIVAGSALACGPRSGGGSMETTRPLTTGASLYDRLGKLDAIRAVVDDFVTRMAADPVISPRFTSVDLPHLKQMLVEQICEASGGPCKYTGRSMAEAHAGLHLSDAEFAALMADLKQSLGRLSVPPREQDELLGILGGMKGDVVDK